MTDDDPAAGARDGAPARSVPGAVLLNLTGLGLGYGYLRRWWLAGAALAGTVALMVAGAVVGMYALPWLWGATAMLWAGLLAAHAGVLAHRYPGPAGRRPVFAGVVAVVLVAGGVAGYGAMARAATTDGIAAARAGDCAAALDRFDAATGVYRLGADVMAADAGRRECNVYLRGARARERGDYAAAVRAYRDMAKAFSRGAMAGVVRRELAETYLEQAGDWTEPLDLPTAREAAEALVVVHEEFGDTPAAERVPEMFAELFTAASKPFTREQACASLPVMNYFAAIDPAVATDVVSTADTTRADALLECGLSTLRSGNAVTAAPILDNYVNDYPSHPRYRQGKAAQISARVAARAKARLPVPPPLGARGSVPLTFYNDSRKAYRVLVAGATAHDITLPPCTSCPAVDPAGEQNCGPSARMPSRTVWLDPRSAYYYALDIPAGIATWDTYPLGRTSVPSYICLYFTEQKPPRRRRNPAGGSARCVSTAGERRRLADAEARLRKFQAAISAGVVPAALVEVINAAQSVGL